MKRFIFPKELESLDRDSAGVVRESECRNTEGKRVVGKGIGGRWIGDGSVGVGQVEGGRMAQRVSIPAAGSDELVTTHTAE
jgi:hypothetical protein